MKIKVAFVAMLLILISITSIATATTFHGNAERSGYFDCTGVKIGKILWKANLTGLVDASPIYWNGYVYVSNWYGWKNWSPGLYCINATTGEIVWRNAEITGASTAALSNGLLFIGSLSGKLYCVNATTGIIVWNKTLENNPEWYGIASSPLVYNGKVYVTTFSNGCLHALDLNGNELWSYSTNAKSSYYSSPSAYNGKIFFAGGNKLYCLNEYGNVLWSFNASDKILNTPSVGYGNVYFATESRFYCVNVSNGLENWNTSLNGTISTAALAYGNAYIGSKDGIFYCFNATTGKEVWKFKANGKIDSSPAIAENMVYFATNTPNGTIYALNTSDGSLIWTYSLNPPKGFYYNVMSSPFIAGNKLFIGADDGNVYCFTPILWSGKVNLSLASITINLTDEIKQIKGNMALVALIEASKIGKFDVSVVNSTWGLYVESIAGIKPKGFKGWMYAVNGIIPNIGVADYELKDGDVVEFFYGSWNTDPNDAEYIVTIYVNVTNILWDGEVKLKQGTFKISIDNSEYEVNNLTALGALNAASVAAGFNYTVNDKWYESWNSLLVDSIFGIKNEGMAGWMYWVNYPKDPMPMTGANSYKIKDRDIVYWYYSTTMNDTPLTAPYVIKVKVKVENVVINSFNVSNAKRGKYAEAFVNLSVDEDDWYAIVVSGIDNGEAIAGISTAYLNANEATTIPVLIPIPQQIPNGDYKLYVGVYKLKTFPNELIKWYGYKICEVN